MPRRIIAAVSAFVLACTLALPGCSFIDRIQSSEESGQDAGGYQAVVTDEPTFTDDEIEYAERHLGYESYSRLDSLGRCGEAEACLGEETMPAYGEERGNISEVKPTGWHSVRYDCVEGESLYNRCHLIGWKLSAENDNERNLVTGTRWMNATVMLPFEDEVAEYIYRTDNHVLYRATPDFQGRELVCRGIRIEAYSLEDDGRGVSFNAYCPNTQPEISINYMTGDSSEDAPAEDSSNEGVAMSYVLNTNTMKFHKPTCESVTDAKSHNLEQFEGTREQLMRKGYEPCGRCNP